MNTTPIGSYCPLEAPKGQRNPRRKRNRRRKRTTVLDFVERSIQNEYQAICLFRAAAERAHGPVASLFRRLAKDEEFHLEFLEDWYLDLMEDWEKEERLPRLRADKKRIGLAAQVMVAQMPADNRVLLDHIIEKKQAHRDFYVQQRYHLKGRKLRTTLSDLADEENIHLDQLLQAAGYPPLPRMELEDAETVH